MPDVLRIPLKILRVEEHFETKYVSGYGENAVTSKRSIGWFLVLDNLLILPCGPEKPPFEPHDPVYLSVEKRNVVSPLKV